MHPPSWRAFLALGLLALTARLVPVFVLGPERYATRGYLYYEEMADNLLAGDGLVRLMPYGQGERRAIRTPGYPLLVAGLKSLPGDLTGKIALCGAIFGAASAMIAAFLAARAFGARAGMIAGILVAIWPHAVVHDAAMQDTALYSALMLAAIAVTVVLIDRSGSRTAAAIATAPATALAVSLGALAAAGVLVRVTLLPSMAILIALVAWHGSASVRRRLALAGLATLVLLAGLSPWLLRNARVVGAPVLTSDAGRSLWLGNNPQTFSVYPRQSIDRSEESAWAALSQEDREHVRALGAARPSRELEQDAWFRDRALQWMRENPGAAIVGFARKALATISPWMSPRAGTLKQLVHFLAWGGALALGALGAWRHRARLLDLSPLWLPVLLLVLHSAVFFGHSAYRAHADALVLVFAAPVIARLGGSERKKGTASGAGSIGLIVFAAALILRMGVLLVGGDLALPERPWERGYEVGSVARSLADGRGFSDPFDGSADDDTGDARDVAGASDAAGGGDRGISGGPPFFGRTGPTAAVGPLLPAAWALLLRAAPDESTAWRLVRLLVALASAAVAPALVAGAARIGRPRAGIVAAIAWSIHPGAVLAVRSLLPGVFPIFAIVGILAVLAVLAMLVSVEPGGPIAASTPVVPSSLDAPPWRRRVMLAGLASLAGLTLGASAWVEPLLLPIAVAWTAWILVTRRAAARSMLMVLGLALLVASPWVVRNAIVVGTTGLRSWVGPELLLGATAGPGEPTPLRLHPTRNRDELARLQEIGEAGYVREARARAFEIIRDRPARFVASCAWRYSAFWLGRASWWRSADHPLLSGPASAARGALHAGIALAAAAAIALLFRRRDRLAPWLLIALAVYPLPYALTHVEARYRLPIEPLLLLVIALAFVRERQRDAPGS